MPDEKTEEKTKQTVPALERTARGVAAHVAAVQDRQWDKERKVFSDPVIGMLALFTYAKITASLLAEAEERLAKQQAAFEKRIAEFETRLTTMEKWKMEAEAQTMEMVKNAEEMMAAGPEAFLDKMRSALPPPPQIVDAEVKTLPTVKKAKNLDPPKLVAEVRDTNGKKDGVA